MSPSRDTPSLAEVLSRALDRRLSGLHVAVPGEVQSYDAESQSVTVQPMIRRGYYGETGDRETETLPAVQGVPVVFPGAAGYRVTFPIAKGDTVLLVFASQSLDQWLTLGGIVDPLDERRHALSDAIAIPGLRSFSDPLGDAPTDRMSIGNDTGPTIEIDDTEIRLGSNSASALLALKSDVQTIRDQLHNHTHSAGTYLDSSSGAVTGTSGAGPAVTAPTGTTKVKAE